jgi:ABC-type nitrate/sulfonate/bicarbonate transport system substrate-binding protein
MELAKFSLLRGICQIPAYVAAETGLFAQHGIDARIDIAPTAWVVPERLAGGALDFAVLPWTRVAAAKAHGEDLVLLAGSGIEEAALVVRRGLDVSDVRTVAVPHEGGMKDLTGAALMKSLGLGPEAVVRLPSGDGAILAFIGQGADAACMVEPYATMLERLGLGTIVRRTGDVWPGAPGCSLATSRRLLADRPDFVRAVVRAFVLGAERTTADPAAAAAIASRYIGVSADIVRAALDANQPDVRALHNTGAMRDILRLMGELGYLREIPDDFSELGLLEEALGLAAGA